MVYIIYKNPEIKAKTGIAFKCFGIFTGCKTACLCVKPEVIYKKERGQLSILAPLLFVYDCLQYNMKTNTVYVHRTSVFVVRRV